MKYLVSFFEIPVRDFNRAVQFYQQVLKIELKVMESESEKMAFFPEEDGCCPGAISWTADGSFKPADNGVLISLTCEDICQALRLVVENRGKVILPKTKIETEGKGYFSLFIDPEGNRLGFYSNN